jgi:hypothetical protein
LFSGCSERLPTSLSRDDESPEVKKFLVEVTYAGNETIDEVRASILKLESIGITLSTEEQEQMLADYAEYLNDAPKLMPLGSWYSAYGSHNVADDLWLEYKWWAGSPQGYHMETPIWGIYWLIQMCYGGNLTNWSWMEGGYQRVTCVVGSCLHVPYSDGFLRYYLRVRTH